MVKSRKRNLYLPAKDRSHWKVDQGSDLPLCYLAWGRRDFSQEFMPECLHEGWVCTIIEEGHPVMAIRGEDVRLSPRQMVLIGPDCSFGWPARKGSTCKFVQWMWSGLDTAIVQGLSRDISVIRNLPRGKYQPLRDNHDQCRREVLMQNSLSFPFLNASRSLFEILLQRVLESEDHSDQLEVRLKQAMRWMGSHLDSKEPIARLCDYLDISQSTLHRLFKAQTGESPVIYFHGLRMQEAQRLLKLHSFSVKEVSYKLGYQHAYDFSRAYKAFFGSPPSVDLKRRDAGQ